MGLDLVEFTMAVEDAFQIPIPDRDAADIRTPGQLVDYLLGRLTPARAPDCLDQRVEGPLASAASTGISCTTPRPRPSGPHSHCGVPSRRTSRLSAEPPAMWRLTPRAP